MSLRALDLFCCAGGASMGLAQAGFEVVGVDIKAQPNYPFEFHQADALTFALDGFDFVWASPPCQAHTSLKAMHNAKKHEDLIPQTREKLKRSGLAWVIENVVGAPLIDPFTLCGTMFGLGTGDAELRRHRLFETNYPVLFVPECRHVKPRVIGVYGGHGRDRRRTHNTQDFSVEQRREAMGIDWMSGTSLSQALPPAYAEFIGRAAIAHIEAERLAA